MMLLGGFPKGDGQVGTASWANAFEMLKRYPMELPANGDAASCFAVDSARIQAEIRSAPSSFASVRSNVPMGTCPALRAISSNLASVSAANLPF